MTATWQFLRSFGGRPRKALRFLAPPCQNGTIHSHFGESRVLRLQPNLLLERKKRALRVLLVESSGRPFAKSGLRTTLRPNTRFRRGLLLRCVARHRAPWRLVFAPGCSRKKSPFFASLRWQAPGHNACARGDCSQLAPAKMPCRWFTVRSLGFALPCLARCPR